VSCQESSGAARPALICAVPEPPSNFRHLPLQVLPRFVLPPIYIHTFPPPATPPTHLCLAVGLTINLNRNNTGNMVLLVRSVHSCCSFRAMVLQTP